MKKKQIIFYIFLILFLLPIFFKGFRLNIISGGDHLLSASETKKEAIKRGVYVCDIKLPYTPFVLNDTVKLDFYEGWVEKSWRSGYFFWTTIPDEGYEIRLKIKSATSNTDNMTFINPIENISLSIYKGDFYCRTHNIDNSDTIEFNLYQNYNIQNPDSNIIGSLALILQRKTNPNN